ncbi:MAG: DUF305 domain-containing protein [Janthinobacterium lividum]
MKSLVAALTLSLCSGAAVCQSVSTGSAPTIVQPGAPGEPAKTLTAVAAQPAPRPPSEADIRFMQDMIMHHGQAVEMTELAKTRAASPAVVEMAAKIDLSQGDEIRWMKQWLAERGIAPETMADMPGMQMSKPITTEPDGTAVTHLGHENAAHTAHTNSEQARMAAMNHAQTDHDEMAGMDHSQMSGMDHGDMAGMDHEAAPASKAKKADPMDTAMMPGMLTPRQMIALRAANGKQFDRLFLTGMMQHHNGALLMVKDLFQQPGAGQDPQLFDFATDVDNTQLAEIDIMKGILRKVNP